eukprot:TRINITY_DN22384_c0_g1_i6.p2 TRINITY_DN22384_c0_g1~~TRINITY_DN22384_c0_g1_i6.p2  ORF type:complete len:105 (-),score=5.25 TRINITY_DN22384_c0_g1_i6:23-337(-)
MKNISDSIIVMRREREIKEKDILGNRENEICIQVRYAHKLVAVEVLKNSAWFVDREGQKVLLGRVRAKLRLLNSLGWRIVISLVYYMFKISILLIYIILLSVLS